MTFEEEMKKLIEEDSKINERLRELQTEADSLTIRKYEIRGALKTLDDMRERLIAEKENSDVMENPDKTDTTDTES